MSDLESATPGQILANRREASELSLREVADALNLPISTLEDIEADALDRLPAEVYTRGYVRAYARYLELDPESIVAALAYSGSDETELVSKPQQTLFDLNNPTLRLVLIGCAVFLVIVGLWYFLSSSDDTDSDVTDADVFETEPTRVDNRAANSVPLQAAEFETTAPVELPSIQSVQGTVVEDEPARRLTATGEEQLQLTFTDECWVEIKTSDGTTLHGDLGRAGIVWEFVGEGPFQLLLGYAPGVTLRFNQEPVSLVPHTRNNVARLVLGQ